MSCNGVTTINFITLTLIRGTTPLMLFYAADQLNSASLVVAIKCAITMVLFLFSSLWQAKADPEVRMAIKRSFLDKSLFWRIVVVGFLQSFAPYIFAIYSLKYLPPTMVATFIVIIPWFGMLMERLPFVNLRQQLPGMIKIGMLCGFIGICFMLGPIIKGSLECPTSIDAFVINSKNKTNNTLRKPEFYTCETGKELAIGACSLIIAPILWGMASVFWKLHRRETHPLVQSTGQNLCGAIFAAITYGIERAFETSQEHAWKGPKSIASIVFLGVLTGWFATLLVQYLCSKIGPKMTNQVLTGVPFIAFIEETILVKDVITIEPYIIALEIVGLLLLTGGVFISFLPSADPPEESTHSSRRNSLSENLLNDEAGSEGVMAGLHQAYTNNIHQYVPVQQEGDDDFEASFNQPLGGVVEDDVETEEEINLPNDDARSRTPYPKLTEMT